MRHLHSGFIMRSSTLSVVHTSLTKTDSYAGKTPIYLPPGTFTMGLDGFFAPHGYFERLPRHSWTSLLRPKHASFSSGSRRQSNNRFMVSSSSSSSSSASPSHLSEQAPLLQATGPLSCADCNARPLFVGAASWQRDATRARSQHPSNGLCRGLLESCS